MKTLIKVAVLLLALLMVVPCLAACGAPAETTAPKGDDPTVKPPVDPDYKMPEVVDMNRYVYKVFTRSETTGNGAFRCEDFYVDPAQGGADALSYAVIQRNNEIEKTYNCVIKQQPAVLASQFDEMTTFFDGNTKFELAIIMSIDAAICATAGYLSDLKAGVNSKWLNLDHEAFDQNSIKELTLGTNLYYLSGDMNISSLDNTISTIFNLEMFEKSKAGIAEKLGHDRFGDLYQMVIDGTWTVENMLAIANSVTVDAKSDDGELAYDKGDTIGYFEYRATPLYYFYGAGLRMTETEDGYPVFTITSEESREVYEFLFNNLNILKNPQIPTGASGDRGKNFLAGKTLIADFLLWDVRKSIYPAAVDWAYGILPIPTYEEGADYHCVVYFQNCHHLWAIPYKRESVENSARMMYIMAAYSGKPDSTMDAYYVRTMYMEVARDDGSRASLDIIRGSLVYDIALLYTQNGLWGNFDKMLIGIGNKNNMEYDTYTSESAMTKANMDLQKTLDDFANKSEGDGN